jgi:hypothetical protein
MGIVTRTGGTIALFGESAFLPLRGPLLIRLDHSLTNTAAMGFTFTFGQAVTANIREVSYNQLPTLSCVVSSLSDRERAEDEQSLTVD